LARAPPLQGGGRGFESLSAHCVWAKRELVELVEEITFVEITDTLIVEAAELAEAEALRGCDAIHLAAALVIGPNVLTSADAALCVAAERRGLHVANPLEI
jgi:predicted nucleic acid-binding protein